MTDELPTSIKASGIPLNPIICLEGEREGAVSLLCTASLSVGAPFYLVVLQLGYTRGHRLCMSQARKKPKLSSHVGPSVTFWLEVISLVAQM
jgi:hypothetical protein